MTGLIVFSVIFGGILVWFLSSIRRVGPTEMAVKVMFSEPVEYQTSGFVFVPRLPGCYLIRTSTKQYKVDIPAVTAYSREGTYRGKRYGSEPLTVNSTLYLFFPRDERLIQVVRAGMPTTEEGLVSHLTNAVQEAVRIAIGQFVWKTATQNVAKIKDKADQRFKGDECPLKKAGFQDEDFDLVIEEIKVPTRLQELMSQPDEERFKAQAAESVAERKTTEQTGMVLRSFAKFRGKTTEEIQQEIDDSSKLQREFLDYAKDLNIRIEEADRGALIHFVSDNPSTGSFLDAFAAAHLKKVSPGVGSPKQPGEKREKKAKKIEEWDGEEDLEVE
jgi:hypothetical protein